MLKDGYNEFSAKIDEKEKNKLSELEKEYSRKKNNLISDKKQGYLGFREEVVRKRKSL